MMKINGGCALFLILAIPLTSVGSGSARRPLSGPPSPGTSSWCVPAASRGPAVPAAAPAFAGLAGALRAAANVAAHTVDRINGKRKKQKED